MEGKTLKNIWKKIQIPIISVVCSIIAVLCVAAGTGFFEKDYVGAVYRDRTELSYFGARDRLVTTIDNYIQENSKGSCLNGITILEACEEYSIDIAFVLAQGQLESHFGTTGMAARTNSVFNVFAYDNKSIGWMIEHGKTFKHPDESVRPYIKLLRRRYLVDKTEHDLMHNYVDIDGKRYASSKAYEQKLTDLYIKIDSIIREDLAAYRKAKVLSRK